MWRRRKREPADGLDRELRDYREADATALAALRLVQKRLGLGLEDAFARLREHPAWRDASLVHELSDRRVERVVQAASWGGMVVLKEYCHDESAFDPPEQDDYEFFEYELELGGRVYEARRYVDEDEASIRRSEAIVRGADAEAIARFLIEREGVRRVTRLSRRTGAYTRIVALGPGWSGLDALVLLVLRDGPVRLRDLRSTVKAVNSVAPDEREVAASRRRLRGAGLVNDDGDRLELTDESRRLLADAAGDRFWDEWWRLKTELERLPLPEAGD
ncbi:MAG TPA: hypothetical protein VLB86_16285 [Gaiellaceae bacterium]|nr:hypothetical protein [Gaiellaceae bacterium]